MNGYFERLIARSTGTGSDVRPLARQMQGIPPEEISLAGSDEFLSDTPYSSDRAQSSTRAVRDNASTAKATETAGTADTRAPTLHTDVSAVVSRALDRQTIPVKTTAGDSGEMPLRQSVLASDSSSIIKENNASPIRGAHMSHTARVAQSVDPAITTQPIKQDVHPAAEEFRLMPLQPRSSSRDTVPSLPVSPSAQVSSEAGAQVFANLSPSGQRSNQHAEHESPTIQVTIGRVEIRATVAPTPARKTPAKSPAMSLDEYLKQRNGSRR